MVSRIRAGVVGVAVLGASIGAPAVVEAKDGLEQSAKTETATWASREAGGATTLNAVHLNTGNIADSDPGLWCRPTHYSSTGKYNPHDRDTNRTVVRVFFDPSRVKPPF